MENRTLKETLETNIKEILENTSDVDTLEDYETLSVVKNRLASWLGYNSDTIQHINSLLDKYLAKKAERCLTEDTFKFNDGVTEMPLGEAIRLYCDKKELKNYHEYVDANNLYEEMHKLRIFALDDYKYRALSLYTIINEYRSNFNRRYLEINSKETKIDNIEDVKETILNIRDIMYQEGYPNVPKINEMFNKLEQYFEKAK